MVAFEAFPAQPHGRCHPVRQYLRGCNSLPELQRLAQARGRNVNLPLNDLAVYELSTLSFKAHMAIAAGVDMSYITQWCTLLQTKDVEARTRRGRRGPRGLQGPAGAAGISIAQLNAALAPIHTALAALPTIRPALAALPTLADLTAAIEDAVAPLATTLEELKGTLDLENVRRVNSYLFDINRPIIPVGTIEPAITTLDELHQLDENDVLERLDDLGVVNVPGDLTLDELHGLLWRMLGARARTRP